MGVSRTIVYGTTASASISTSSAGSMSLLTSTIDVAGRIEPKNLPWARPTSCQLLMSVTKIRVRTTSCSPAPACSNAAAEGGGAIGGADVGAQTREALRRIAAALEQAGAGLQDVVRTRIFVTDISSWQEVGRAHGEFFGSIRPATSMVEVSRLIDPALLVEIEADAVVP